MSVIDYQSKAYKADRMIKRAGAKTKVKKVTEVSYSPTPGGTIPKNEIDCFAVVFDVETDQIDGKNILKGDQIVYCSAVAMELPKPDWKFLWRGVWYNIHLPKDLAPNGISVLFEFVIRLQ